MRARVAGLADNKGGSFGDLNVQVYSIVTTVVIGTISGFLFLCIVMISSFITGYFMDAFDQPSSFGAGYFFLFSPFAVVQDLVAAAIRVIRDEELAGIFSEPISRSTRGQSQASPGLIQNFIYRFLIGLPLVGAGSIVQVLVSFGMLAPTQFIARYRATRRKYNSRDLAALIVVALLAAGAIRFVHHKTDGLLAYTYIGQFSRCTNGHSISQERHFSESNTPSWKSVDSYLFHLDIIATK